MNKDKRKIPGTPKKLTIVGNRKRINALSKLKNMTKPKNFPRINSLLLTGLVRISKAVPELISSEIDLAKRKDR